MPQQFPGQSTALLFTNHKTGNAYFGAASFTSFSSFPYWPHWLQVNCLNLKPSGKKCSFTYLLFHYTAKAKNVIHLYPTYYIL